MVQVFGHHIVPLGRSEFSEVETFFPFERVCAQLLGFLDESDDAFSLVLETFVVCDDEHCGSWRVVFVRRFAHDFGLYKVFQKPFGNKSGLSVFFRFVDEFVGYIAVRQHFVYRHHAPFWERIFRKRIDSLDEMARIVLVENILHSLVGDFVDLIQLFN